MEEFVALRQQRDRDLDAPKWQDFAIPANLHCMNLGGIQSLLVQTADGRH